MSLTSQKVPHFFIYAKNKSPDRVQRLNNSVVNRLETVVPNKRMNFTAKNIGVFRYKYMLSVIPSRVNMVPEVIDLYDEVEKQYRYSVNFYDDETNYAYVRDFILEQFSQLGISMDDICNTLVKHLFHDKKSKRKAVFWMCFGDIVLQNLRNNVPVRSIQCRKCGERFVPSAPNQKVCKKCSSYQRKGKKTVKCVDCGKEFEVDSRNMKKIRCDECQKEYRKQWDRERKRRVSA